MRSVIILISLAIILILLSSQALLAWSGYDRGNKTDVEIGPGTLVREGEIIEFYDWEQDSYHKAEIKSIDALFHGTKLHIYDLDDRKNRTLEMRED